MDDGCTLVIYNGFDSRTTASGDVTMDTGEVLIDPIDTRWVPTDIFNVKVWLVEPQQIRD